MFQIQNQTSCINNLSFRLEDFLPLFCNHKPARGDDIADLKKVFKIIGKDSNEDPNTIPDINREDLIEFLKSGGDVFKEKDFNQFLTPLFTSRDHSSISIMATMLDSAIDVLSNSNLYNRYIFELPDESWKPL